MIVIKTNANEVSLDLRKLALGADQLKPLMRQIAGDLEDVTESAFEKEADPVTGRKWEALKAPTIESRRRRNKWPGKKLQVTGRLATSITSRFTQTKARIGTNLKYAGTHQKGIRGRNIPQRRFIGLGPADLVRLRKTVHKFLVNRFNSA